MSGWILFDNLFIELETKDAFWLELLSQYTGSEEVNFVNFALPSNFSFTFNLLFAAVFHWSLVG